MFEVESSVCIEASVGRVWAALSTLEDIHLWVRAIQRSYMSSAERRGLGVVRVCKVGGGVEVHETIIDWREGESFTYRGRGAPMMKRAENRWSVKAHGAGQTLVTSTAVVELKGGVVGRALEPLARLMVNRVGPSTLASLKYFVEHGEEYPGNLSDLPRPVAAC